MKMIILIVIMLVSLNSHATGINQMIDMFSSKSSIIEGDSKKEESDKNLCKSMKDVKNCKYYKDRHNLVRSNIFKYDLCKESYLKNKNECKQYQNVSKYDFLMESVKEYDRKNTKTKYPKNCSCYS